MQRKVPPYVAPMPRMGANRAMPAAKGNSKVVSSTVMVPKGHDLHVRKIDNGHIAVVRDKNYNTVSETFVKDTSAIKIK